MIKVGITGSLASGKSTATKILSAFKGPFFSADAVVKKLYTKNKFKKIIIKNFNLKNSLNIKKLLKEKIIEDKSNIKKLRNPLYPHSSTEIRKRIEQGLDISSLVPEPVFNIIKNHILINHFST